MDNMTSNATGQPFAQPEYNPAQAALNQTPPPQYYPGERTVAANDPQPVADKPENKVREIRINQVNHGYIVTVGCHTFAIESADTLIEKLEQYLDNPAATEEKWFKKQLF